jgi:hypothetical protein
MCAEVTAELLMSRLRLAVGMRLYPDDLANGDDVTRSQTIYFSLGVADLVGTSYWVAQALHPAMNREVITPRRGPATSPKPRPGYASLSSLHRGRLVRLARAEIGLVRFGLDFGSFELFGDTSLRFTGTSLSVEDRTYQTYPKKQRWSGLPTAFSG